MNCDRRGGLVAVINTLWARVARARDLSLGEPARREPAGVDEVMNQRAKARSVARSGTSPHSAAPPGAATLESSTGAATATRAPSARRAARQAPLLLSVPSKAAPTLKKAVAAVRNNGTIRVRRGTQSASIIVANKFVHFVGAAASTRKGAKSSVIKGNSRNKPVISLGPNGGGTIERLTLRGGSAGVAGGFGAGLSNGVVPAPVTLKNVAIIGARQGVFGRFGSLAAQDVSVSGATRNGVVIFGATSLNLLRGRIDNCGGTGIAIYNSVPGALYMIDGVSVNSNTNTGITAVGHAGLVIISNVTAVGNRRAAVPLSDADHTIVKGSVLSKSLPKLNSTDHGDGVQAIASDSLTIDGNEFSGNARVGLISVGGSGVGYGNNLFADNGTFDLVDLDGPGVSSQLVDMGGNTCKLAGVVGECSRYTDGDFVVPDEPAEVPPSP